MTAIEKDVLQNELCANCDCSAFNPVLDYEIDLTAKTLTVTVNGDSSYDTGDSLKRVLVHVHDEEGKSVHDDIDGTAETPETSAEVNVEGLTLNHLKILFTVVSAADCKKDFTVRICGSALSGTVGKVEETEPEPEPEPTA